MARKSNPIGGVFKVIGAINKISKAIDRSNRAQAREAARQEREMIREAKESARERNEEEKARKKKYESQQKEMQLKYKNELKEKNKILNLQNKELLKNKKIKAIEEQKILLSKEKKEQQEILESLSVKTIQKFKLCTTDVSRIELNKELSISSLVLCLSIASKEKAKEKIHNSKINLDEFIWSGKINSVLGPKGLLEFKKSLEEIIKNDTDLEDKKALLDQIYSFGIYYQSDFRNSDDMIILNQWRLILRTQLENENFANTEYEKIQKYVHECSGMIEKSIMTLKEYQLNVKLIA